MKMEMAVRVNWCSQAIRWMFADSGRRRQSARPGESVIAAAPDAAVERLLRLIEDSLPSLGRKQESNDS